MPLLADTSSTKKPIRLRIRSTGASAASPMLARKMVGVDHRDCDQSGTAANGAAASRAVPLGSRSAATSVEERIGSRLLEAGRSQAADSPRATCTPLQEPMFSRSGGRGSAIAAGPREIERDRSGRRRAAPGAWGSSRRKAEARRRPHVREGPPGAGRRGVGRDRTGRSTAARLVARGVIGVERDRPARAGRSIGRRWQAARRHDVALPSITLRWPRPAGWSRSRRTGARRTPAAACRADGAYSGTTPDVAGEPVGQARRQSSSATPAATGSPQIEWALRDRVCAAIAAGCIGVVGST